MHHPNADVERVYLPRNEGDGNWKLIPIKQLQ